LLFHGSKCHVKAPQRNVYTSPVLLNERKSENSLGRNRECRKILRYRKMFHRFRHAGSIFKDAYHVTGIKSPLKKGPSISSSSRPRAKAAKEGQWNKKQVTDTEHRLLCQQDVFEAKLVDTSCSCRLVDDTFTLLGCDWAQVDS